MELKEPTITACILARNEERRIEEALRSLVDWTDQILVIDNESDDRTAEVARQYTQEILTAPRALNFDAARNLAIEAAAGEWIFYLDADERVPAALGQALRRLVREEGGRFEAAEIPFKHHFCGRWMQNHGWWPGYTRPQLVKKGFFHYNERLHGGVFVDGRVIRLPPDPELAIVHYSYDDIAHFIAKTNAYTDAEAENLLDDGNRHSWQVQLAGFVHDWQLYYDELKTHLDGMHGFELAFLYAFYRFASRAKLWDLRRKRGELPAFEPVPRSVNEMLRFMLHYNEHGAGTGPLPAPGAGPARDGAPIALPEALPALPALPRRPPANPVPLDPALPVDFQAALGRPLRVRWEGDFTLRSSLALVNRELCLGLRAADDVELSLREERTEWHRLPVREERRWASLLERCDAELSGPPDVTVRHHYPPDWSRPESGKLVLLQPWEYGSLPREWVEGAVRHADEVWAYSRAVRDIYVRSGVPAEKVRVVPLGVRTEVFRPKGRKYALPTEKGLRFLFVGGAIHRKGADLLLEAYRRAFTAADDVSLVIKDMGGTTFYQGESQVETIRRLQLDPEAPEIIYLEEDLSEARLASLYRSCHCVVLPYRGEGFGLTPLEGMACGLPAIVTAGGSTDDYLDDSMALRVPARRRRYDGALPWPCVGEPWMLEPELDALVAAFRWVRDHPEETRGRGAAAREQVLAGWSWERPVAIVRERLLQVAAPSPASSIPAARAWLPSRDDSPGDAIASAVPPSAEAADVPAEPAPAVCGAA